MSRDEQKMKLLAEVQRLAGENIELEAERDTLRKAYDLSNATNSRLVAQIDELESVIKDHFSAPVPPADSGAAAVHRELAAHFKERGAARYTGRQLCEWFRVSAYIIERESKP